MAKRKRKGENLINGKAVVGASGAAAILTRRAKEMGFNRRYSRDTIYRHYSEGSLIPALETPSGNLYYVEDIEKLPINPNIGKRGKAQADEEDTDLSDAA